MIGHLDRIVNGCHPIVKSTPRLTTVSALGSVLNHPESLVRGTHELQGGATCCATRSTPSSSCCCSFWQRRLGSSATSPGAPASKAVVPKRVGAHAPTRCTLGA